MTHRNSALIAVLTVGLFAMAATAEAAKEGFGRKRKILQLSRVNPPRVLILGERISVEVGASDRDHHEIAQRFRAQLASELVGGDSRLKLDSDRPETLLKVEVLQHEFRSYNERRKETQRRSAGKDRNGKDVYHNVEVTVMYTKVDHDLRFAYTLTEARDGATLLADSSHANYSAVFREGSSIPTRTAVEGTSLDKAVYEIVHQLTPTREPIEVLLPKGTLEDQISFAEAGLWNRYSENLEMMSPFPTAQEDSYRQYGIGLAYEALGYSAEGPETALRYLEKAAEQYNLALNANPEEKYFSQPFEGSFLGSLGRKTLGSLRGAFGGGNSLASEPEGKRRSIPAPIRRVETSLAKYRASLDQSKELIPVSSADAKSLTGDGGGDDGLTNEQVIEMVEAELEEEIIMTAIEDAPQCAFDRSPMGLIQLKKAGVSKTIISQIQASTCGS